MSGNTHIPLIVRGEILDEPLARFGGRRGELEFSATDVREHLKKIPLGAPSQMADLYDISFDDILEYLGELGDRIAFGKNPYLQEAFKLACVTSGISEPVLRTEYERLPRLLAPSIVRNCAERAIGIEYLEGWVEQNEGAMPGVHARVRAFGSRHLHIIAGNSPLVSVLTVMRNAITRSDAIIKAPSNDPLTTAAIVRTMIDMAPGHPLTKHISVGYWKGGDEQIESWLYDPRRIEKITAWGGFASVKHVAKYLQPGLELITLDPKLSGTIIGPEAFSSEQTLREVARRLSFDIGAVNQEGCVNARVVYAVSGVDEAGVKRATRLGELTFEALQNLPSHFSTPHKAFDPELKSEIDGIRHMDDDYCVFGGKSDEGAIIVSQSDAPVDFSRLLACRVANIVPIDDTETAVRSVNAYTQTIGVYPESLKDSLSDRLAFQGAQRIVPLGGAGTMMHSLDRQDGIEPVRRMCKWIVQERCDDGWFEAMPG